jgi:hypothetical protein
MRCFYKKIDEMKKKYLVLALLGLSSLANAQSSTDYKPNTPNYSEKGKTDPIPFAPPPPPNPIPIDGGLGFLLAAGLSYGLKRIKATTIT